MSYSRDPSIPGLKHLPSIPYRPHPTRLQTLDIWLPDHPPKSTPTTKPTWIIYVHGGAWRDPTQDSLCAIPTIRSLVKNHANLLDEGHIEGIASFNYRLSPYPSHGTDPSAPDDQDRNVCHPAHVQDVYYALEFLIKEYEIERWVGVGHSCGATLLLQLPLVSGVSSVVQRTLEGLVLLAGIYDVPAFLKNHSVPGCPENIAAIYRRIVEGAFGLEAREYEKVSPVGMGKKDLWGRLVALGYSVEDGLVESQQREAMLGKYLQEGWTRSEDTGEGAKVVEVKNITMGHDEVWEDGGQVASLIAEVTGRLRAKGEAL
jgi:hypothetical protein